MNLKDLILAETDLKTEAVDVPEWPNVQKVWVRSVDGKSRGYFENLFVEFNKGQTESLIVKLCAATMCDEEGNLIFDGKQESLDALGTRNGAVLSRIAQVSMKINGLGAAAVQEAKGN